eukprot:3155010-Lingulodinium_polyedra.AAC.1
MLAALELVSHAVAEGCFALMEHPAVPWKAEAPSVWLTEALQRLLAAPGVTRLTFYQGDLGN